MKSLNQVKKYLELKVQLIESTTDYKDFFQTILDKYKYSDIWLKANCSLSDSDEGWDVLYIRPIDTYVQYETTANGNLNAVYIVDPHINNGINVYPDGLNINREKEIIEYVKANPEYFEEVIKEYEEDQWFSGLLIGIWETYCHLMPVKSEFPVEVLEDDYKYNLMKVTLYFKELNSIVTIESECKDEPTWDNVEYYFSRPVTEINTTYIKDE